MIKQKIASLLKQASLLNTFIFFFLQRGCQKNASHSAIPHVVSVTKTLGNATCVYLLF
jgi:hypothetical protein